MFAADVVTEAGTRDAALALANRSAVWLKLGQHEACLDDIEAALVFRYPDTMLYKLLDRKAKCLAALGDPAEARVCYNRVVLLLQQAGLDEAKQAAWRKEVAAEVAKLQPTTSPKPRVSALLPDPSKTIPQFSSAVELAYNPLVGRHGG